MRRRTVLTALGATTLGGCLSQSGTVSKSENEDHDPTDTPECDSDLALLTTDLDQKYTIKKGTTEKFSLEIEPASVNLGQDISIHLKNISSESQRTGSRDHYATKRKIMVSGITFFSTKGNVLLRCPSSRSRPK